MSIHYFSYDEEGVEFFKSLKELLNLPARKEDMYVYEGELDEETYNDADDDYRETTAIDYLLKQNEKESQENKELTMKSKVQSDLINNLFAHRVRSADIDDGISISDYYGERYIDKWNKDYDDLIKEHIEIMNECELDDTGLKLVFHHRNCIEFESVPETDEE